MNLHHKVMKPKTKSNAEHRKIEPFLRLASKLRFSCAKITLRGTVYSAFFMITTVNRQIKIDWPMDNMLSCVMYKLRKYAVGESMYRMTIVTCSQASREIVSLMLSKSSEFVGRGLKLLSSYWEVSDNSVYLLIWKLASLFYGLFETSLKIKLNLL